MCLPLVMKSNFSLREPSQALRLIGMSSSRKSPAVLSMKRHWPAEDFSVTLAKARVAVSSRWLASAALVGSRMPPARETEITVLEPATVPAGVLVGVGVVIGADEELVVAVGVGGTGLIALALPVVVVSVVVVATVTPLLPKVNDWLGSAALQAVMSTTLPLTTKQLPGWFCGVKACGPAPPENAKSWEFVTFPPVLYVRI